MGGVHTQARFLFLLGLFSLQFLGEANAQARLFKFKEFFSLNCSVIYTLTFSL